jgi:hypothetical protein
VNGSLERFVTNECDSGIEITSWPTLQPGTSCSDLPTSGSPTGLVSAATVTTRNSSAARLAFTFTAAMPCIVLPAVFWMH